MKRYLPFVRFFARYQMKDTIPSKTKGKNTMKTASHIISHSVGRIKLSLVVLLIAWSCPASMFAADGDLDASFDPGAGADGQILATALQQDGRIIVGGGFSNYGGVSRPRIARVNANVGPTPTPGSLDTSFNPGTGAGTNSGQNVSEIVIQADGNILIGGSFTEYNGVPRSRIARIIRDGNNDGTLDTSFNPGSGAAGLVTGLALQADGKILIGGSFQSYNGVARNGIARINTNGSLDESFNPGTGIGVDFRQILAFAVQPDGKIIICGNFETYNGEPRAGVARVNANGTLDSDFDPGEGTLGDVSAVALSGTGIIIGGAFTDFRGEPRGRLAKLSANGSLDPDFVAGTGANLPVSALHALADGRILIGGQFTSYNDEARGGVARLNADGTLDTTFNSNPGTGGQFGGTVSAISVQQDGKVIIAGSFLTYKGVTRNRIARILSSAATPEPTPTPPEKLRLWVPGRDLVANEKPDAAKEMLATNATVPQWSYGYRSLVNSTDLTPFQAGAHTNAERNQEAVEGWSSNEGVVVVNTGTETVQYFSGNIPFKPLFAAQMLIKRTSTVLMPVVRWTAPVDADYRVTAKWVDLNPLSNGGAGHVVINGKQVFGRQDLNGAFIGQEWPDEGNAMMPTQTFRLQAGAVVDFVLSTRAGDSNTDDTAFSAAIARVPTVTITSPAAEFFEGEDVSISVAVQHNHAIKAVKLLVYGPDQRAHGAEDATAPYQFTLRDVRAGPYCLTAIARDESDAETGSDGTILMDDLRALQPVKIVVKKSGSAAAARAKRSAGSSDANAASAGLTYRCTQSGLWHDPATWGGLGVPGRFDDAIIPQGFQVSYENAAGTPSIEIDNLELSGRLVSNRGLVVFGTMQASGSVVGFADPDAFVLTIADGATFVNVAGPVVFENVIFTNRGTVILGQDGGITGSGTSFVNEGTFKVLPAPGSNRPTVALLRGVEMKGGLISVGPYTHLITTGATGIVAAGAGNIVAAGAGNIVAAGAGNIVAAGAGNLIGSDGASLIGADGASLVGMDGASIVAAGAGNIVAAGAGNLIGSDGGSIVAAGAGNFQGQPDSNKTAQRGVWTAERFETAADVGTISLEGGTVSGNLNLVGNVSNTGAFISPGNSAGKIRITGNYTQESGGTLLLEIGGTGTSPVLQYDQLQITGSANLGGNLIVKTIDGFTPQSGDTFAPLTYNSVSGSFSSVTSNAQVSFGPNGMTMQVSGPNPPAPKALNIATRMKVETGDNALIAGFIITGSQPKKVIIRGIGPSLTFGGTLANPTLDLDGGTITNDDWRTDQEQEIIATTIPPTSNLESAIVATLAPGPHTAILRGNGGATGIGIVEVYDLESGSPVQLANISSRGFVQAGDDVMIGGFIIGGTYPPKVIVRAIGPSLSFPGKLEDPTLELVDQNGGRISNDNWRSTQESEIIATTIPPTNDNEAAIVATLVPGNYTAIVRGVDNTTGIAVVEAYNLQ